MDEPPIAVPRKALVDLLDLADKVTDELTRQKLANPLTHALRGATAEVRSHAEITV